MGRRESTTVAGFRRWRCTAPIYGIRKRRRGSVAGGKCHCAGVITVVLIWREFGGISVVGSEVVVNDLAGPSLCGGYGACPVAGMGLASESGGKIVGCGRINYIIAEFDDDGLRMWRIGIKNID